MKKPVIGILGRVDIDSDNDEFFAAYEKARIAVLRCGGIPVMLLPTQSIWHYEKKNKDIPSLTEEEKEDLCRELDLCDGLLVPGGYRWFKNYDAFLAKEAILRNMPVLGICAGMQMLSTLFSDEIVIEKNNTLLNHHRRNVKKVHRVSIKSDTKLFKIIDQDQIEVNSLHNYHVSKAPNYVVSARSEDGLIEGIELENKDFVIGVQWHPETLLDVEESAEKLLKAFISRAKSYRKS